MSLVAYGDSSESDLEAEESGRAERQASKEDIKKLLSVLPAPRKREKAGSKQPVRIGLPRLEEDDSDDEDLPTVKKARQGGRSGLAAILPEPKGAPASLGGGRRTTTSSMVPYSLTKKTRESKKPTRSRAKAMRSKVTSERRENEDSDSDGEPVSFFSLDDSHSRQSDSNSTAAVTATTTTTTATVFHTTPESGSDSGASQSKHTKVLDPTPSFELAPTHETTGEATGYQATTSSSPWYARLPGQYGASVQGYDSSRQGYHSNIPSGYNVGTLRPVQQPEVPEETTPTGQEATPIMPGPGPGLSIDEETFRRLAGGKKRKDREESLNNIISINEGDMREGMKTYRKYHTEDSVNKLYTPSSSIAPSGMQKRKHQLMWLAHQAQARELELRNHWGQAAQTKRQTQTKYGF